MILEKQETEKIYNIPNLLTSLRVVISFILIYLIFAGFDIFYIVVFFTLGMITDFFDGQIARRFKMTTEFGRKFDVVADRILMLGAALSFVIKFALEGLFTKFYLLQIILILIREIITVPFVIWGFIIHKDFIKVRFAGKLATFLQAFAFPILLLSIFYKQFSFSIYFAILTGIVGLIASFYYIKDVAKKKVIA